jgi:hypothetical protein
MTADQLSHNPATTIRYDLPVSSRVVITLYGLLGEEVATVVDEVQDRGTDS